MPTVSPCAALSERSLTSNLYVCLSLFVQRSRSAWAGSSSALSNVSGNSERRSLKIDA